MHIQLVSESQFLDEGPSPKVPMPHGGILASNLALGWGGETGEKWKPIWA